MTLNDRMQDFNKFLDFDAPKVSVCRIHCVTLATKLNSSVTFQKQIDVSVSVFSVYVKRKQAEILLFFISADRKQIPILELDSDAPEVPLRLITMALQRFEKEIYILFLCSLCFSQTKKDKNFAILYFCWSKADAHPRTKFLFFLFLQTVS